MRIFLVESQPEWLRELQSAAEGIDRILVTAETPEEAMQKIQSEDFDLIITNLSLDPRNDDIKGMEILQHTRMKDPDIPVIIVTHYASQTRSTKAIEEGAFDFIDRASAGMDHKLMLQHKIKYALELRALRLAVHSK